MHTFLNIFCITGPDKIIISLSLLSGPVNRKLEMCDKKLLPFLFFSSAAALLVHLCGWRRKKIEKEVRSFLCGSWCERYTGPYKGKEEKRYTAQWRRSLTLPLMRAYAQIMDSLVWPLLKKTKIKKQGT